MQISLIMALAAIPVYAGVLALAVCLAVAASTVCARWLGERLNAAAGPKPAVHA